MRFEPGDVKTVQLCQIAGKQIVSGGNGLATGRVNLERTEEIVRDLVKRGFAHVPEPGARHGLMLLAKEMDRAAYVAMFGPTVGDRVRLGDTGLYVEVEWDAVRVVYLTTWLGFLICSARWCTGKSASLEGERLSATGWVKRLRQTP